MPPVIPGHASDYLRPQCAVSRLTSWRSRIRPKTSVKGYQCVLSGEIYSYLPLLTLPFVEHTAERDRGGVARTT
jgi:hypothetical protein